jgi:hypothetical protein
MTALAVTPVKRAANPHHLRRALGILGFPLDGHGRLAVISGCGVQLLELPLQFIILFLQLPKLRDEVVCRRSWG